MHKGAALVSPFILRIPNDDARIMELVRSPLR